MATITLRSVKGVPLTNAEVDANFTALNDDKAEVGHTHTLADVTDAGTAAASAIGDFATAAQGTKADTAQQPPVEGAFVDGDKTKLDGIEALADVTDTANVTAAGALMDSEVTNLAAVKAFDPADYAVSDGDVLDVTFTPTNYTPDATPTEATDVDDLAAHLKGIDTALGSAGGGGLVFITSSDLSNDATADFSVFDATKYDGYVFVLQSVKSDTDSVTLRVRTSTDGGSTFDAGSTDYTWATGELDSSTFGDRGSSGDSSIEVSVWLGTSTGETGYTGRVYIDGPHLTENTTITQDGGAINRVGRMARGFGAGQRISATATNAVRFFMSTGNIASGTITMYGMVNA